jgi:hypothetical protein
VHRDKNEVEETTGIQQQMRYPPATTSRWIEDGEEEEIKMFWKC